jgi:acyl-CoA hydrolase
MNTTYKTVAASNITISELMLHTNFSGKIHGGYILSLLDQIAFACASKFSGNYCVTASVDTVDFETNRSGRTSHESQCQLCG